MVEKKHNTITYNFKLIAMRTSYLRFGANRLAAGESIFLGMLELEFGTRSKPNDDELLLTLRITTVCNLHPCLVDLGFNLDMPKACFGRLKNLLIWRRLCLAGLISSPFP